MAFNVKRDLNASLKAKLANFLGEELHKSCDFEESERLFWKKKFRANYYLQENVSQEKTRDEFDLHCLGLKCESDQFLCPLEACVKLSTQDVGAN